MSSSDTYEILALKYAEFTQRRRYESFIAADDHDGPHPIDYFVWVVRNAQRTIVVDTGFDAVEGAKRGRKVARAPAAALEQIGVTAGNVDQVVITHLHYDHAGTLGAFPKARFHLQAAEMAYATGPCMCHAHLRYPFTADHVCEMVKNVYSGRVIFHDGDTEIAPGVSRAQGRRPQPGPAVRSRCHGHRPGRARLRRLALLREFREGQGVPDHHRHRRRAGRLRAPAGAWRPRRATWCPATTRSCCSATPRSTARHRASCTGSTWPGSTPEQTAASDGTKGNRKPTVLAKLAWPEGRSRPPALTIAPYDRPSDWE